MRDAGIAVSYTHLDVYKRQSQSRALQRNNIENFMTRWYTNKKKLALWQNLQICETMPSRLKAWKQLAGTLESYRSSSVLVYPCSGLLTSLWRWQLHHWPIRNLASMEIWNLHGILNITKHLLQNRYNDNYIKAYIL